VAKTKRGDEVCFWRTPAGCITILGLDGALLLLQGDLAAADAAFIAFAALAVAWHYDGGPGIHTALSRKE